MSDQQNPPPPLQTPQPKDRVQKFRRIGVQIGMIVLLIFTPFIQIPLMWIIKAFSLRTRIILTIVGCIYSVFLFQQVRNQESPSKDQATASSSTAQEAQTKTPAGTKFKLGWFGPEVMVVDGVATVEYTYKPGNGNDLYIHGGGFQEPNEVLSSHAKEVSEAVYTIATKHPEVNQIRIGITTTFPAYDYQDRYGKTQSIKAETLHTGYISVSDFSEIRKFTEEAFVHEDWYSKKIADLLNDMNRHEHPKD